MFTEQNLFNLIILGENTLHFQHLWYALRHNFMVTMPIWFVRHNFSITHLALNIYVPKDCMMEFSYPNAVGSDSFFYFVNIIHQPFQKQYEIRFLMLIQTIINILSTYINIGRRFFYQFIPRLSNEHFSFTCIL